VQIGTNVDLASFAQDQAEDMDPIRTVYQELMTVTPKLSNRNWRTVLGSFGFSGETADRRISELSGGERTRLALAKTMVIPVNLLVLDEPTNHLDLPSCDVLEDALGAYPGTVLLVTHDRHLIRGVCDALIEVRNGRAVWHEGVNEKVLNPLGTLAADRGAADTKTAKTKQRSKNASQAPQNTGGSSTAPSKAADKKAKKRIEAEARNTNHANTRDLRKKQQSAERKWEKAESEVADLQALLGDPAVYEDGERVQELVAAHDAAKEKAALLMSDWEAATLALDSGL
jgi:ATP-binding cassette subfamily F protein 3